MTLLSEIEGSGELIESGYVVYSPEAKQRLLRVNPHTIETFNLTLQAAEYALKHLPDFHRRALAGGTRVGTHHE
ncbi:hypothetical protein PS710_00447 [Pseudomonas fluorescens]|uniref:CinA C-terminal domain-containing protein n=1 Tax=Pseudomonas fluorescens TaxID=294 RepID=A0A5E7A4H7_PSEFL|nr:hypothetical protein PS710_00447 [Pseudomonas fluorescens]